MGNPGSETIVRLAHVNFVFVLYTVCIPIVPLPNYFSDQCSL
jgi:hypothetical protein